MFFFIAQHQANSKTFHLSWNIWTNSLIFPSVEDVRNLLGCLWWMSLTSNVSYLNSCPTALRRELQEKTTEMNEKMQQIERSHTNASLSESSFFKKKKKKKKKIYKTVVEQLKAVVKSQGFPLKMLIHSYLSKLCIYTAVNGYDMMCFCVCAQFFRSFHCKIRSGIWSRKNQEEEKLVFNPTGQFWVNCCPFNWNI